MTHEADDRRALFQRVVDDITEQIRTGKLAGGDVLPTARKMAEVYDVASMTAQRALRELQQRGLTYAVVGKGTFVHPLAAERIGIDADGRPITLRHDVPVIPDDPALNRRMAEYILHQHDITQRFVEAMLSKDTPGMHRIAQELTDWSASNQDLIAHIGKYRTEAGTEPAATPTKTRTRTTRPPADPKKPTA
jgi:DNA-binding transcriptional regulator YhcF (GntR family)